MDSDNENAIHMVQMWLDTRWLVELGRSLGLPLHQVDNNYLVHCALGELFGDDGPKPFCVEDAHRQIEEYDTQGGRQIRILGYAEKSKQKLAEQVRMFASPQVKEICDLERMASKQMPSTFSEGTRLGFELRACPVVRKASDGPKWSEGQEVDAFLSRVWEVDDETVNIEREKVYTDWFESQLSNRGGAKPIRVGMERFSLERMTRRTHGEDRTAKTITRPDVTLSGIIEVTEPQKFGHLLESGLGRHKSFGFGMLKIRRP